MEELVQRIVTRVGIDEATARSAIGAILTFLYREGPPDRVRELIERIDGARAYVDTEEGDAATLGGFGGLMGGGAMAVFGKLQQLGLGMGEIQAVTKETVAFAREKAGDQLVEDVIAGIPGLSQFV